MQPVQIYTTRFCGFCTAAKRLLARKGIAFAEVDVSDDPEMRQQMMSRAGGRFTVPQIFVGATHVGGFHELVDLDRRGRLEPLLAG
jgi:glutaredoxin 3